ncbi:hypothetical protein [Deinococcus roseus]|uniref:Uncharacterized protein n=1 Tax=Deinococcus roseus TaxID=392414 RepID=A0ABQ2D8P7_9DEIO|nr:hypothetical protein [Deinococcus roseus]GGJ47798.1 hypothetical protein GCM10008938_37240 [Deinococcus roseus]
MKRLLGFFLMVSGTSLAVQYDTTLYNLIQNPEKFKPQWHWIPADGSIENMRTPTYEWGWKTGKHDDLILRKLQSNMNAWKLSLENSKYHVKNVGLKKIPLFRVFEGYDIGRETLGYQITAGPLKNAYLLKTAFKDGSHYLTVMTKSYALAAGANSELLEGGIDRDFTYPVWAYLTARKRFCSLPLVTCQ